MLTEEEKAKVAKEKTEGRQKAKGYAREAAARAEAGFQEYGGLRDKQKATTASGLTALEQSKTAGQRTQRRSAARGLAASKSAGAFGGGGTGASLRQTAGDIGDRQATFGAESDLRSEQYKQAALDKEGSMLETGTEMGTVASVQGLEGEKFAQEAGTDLQDKQAKMLMASEQMAAIKKDHKGGFWESDDEEGAADAMDALANAEEDPAIAKMYKDEAARIRKEGNWAF